MLAQSHTLELCGEYHHVAAFERGGSRYLGDVSRRLFRILCFEQPTVSQLDDYSRQNFKLTDADLADVCVVDEPPPTMHGLFTREHGRSGASADVAGVVVCSMRSDPGSHLTSSNGTADIK
jgi:hypothetical protein